MINVQDEILADEPRYKITTDEGETLYEKVNIELDTDVNQEGTPIGKALFDSIKGDVYRVDKYTTPLYGKTAIAGTDIKTGVYIGLWGNSHYSKYGINVLASSEDDDNYAYKAMNGVDGYWSPSSVPTVATPALFMLALDEPIILRKFKISGASAEAYCKNFKLQGSTDGDNYYDIIEITNNTSAETEYTTGSQEYYQYFRLRITASSDISHLPAILEFNITEWIELQKINRLELNDITLTAYGNNQRLLLSVRDELDTEFFTNIFPPMQLTNEYGYLIQSSGDYLNTSIIDAFDYDNEYSYWRSLEPQVNRYIRIDMPINVIPEVFTIKADNISNGVIEGSLDGDNWEELYENIEFDELTTKQIIVSTEKRYSKFRFSFNAYESGTSSIIYSFELTRGFAGGLDYAIPTYINVNSLGDRKIIDNGIIEEGNYEFVYKSASGEYEAYLNSFSRGNIENTFTAEEKAKLAGIEVGAEVNIIDGFKLNGTEILPDADRVVSFNNVELDTNKVQSLNNSATQYPSCHAVSQALQGLITFDPYPIEDSTNAVTSGGLYTVIGNVENLLSQI